MPSLSDALHNDRVAWSRLQGCERIPSDPYSQGFLNSLFDRLPQQKTPLQWERVLSAWEEAIQQPGGCSNDLILVSIRDGTIAAVACQNASKGTLTHFREFKFLLSAAMQLVDDGDRVDAAFVLDLTDRADLRWAADERLPRFASTSGACAASLPVPIMLKGYSSNIFQEKLRSLSLGGGAGWRWPSIGWKQKVRRVVWRGAARTYSSCLDLTRRRVAPPDSPCHWRETCSAYCYHRPRETGRASTTLLAMGASAGCPLNGVPHSRLQAVAMRRAESSRQKDAEAVQLDARLTPCVEKGKEAECSATALRSRGLRVNDQPLAFTALVEYIGVLELDGYGWQASLLSKLTLGSVVVAQESLFPLWYDDLLKDGVHLLRTRTDLGDLSVRLQWLRHHGGEAQKIARAGQQRACALLHVPHLARFLRRLLSKYAALFEGPYPSTLHLRVRRRRLGLSGAVADPRLQAPEWLWLHKASRRESTRALCDPWWRGLRKCNSTAGRWPMDER